MTYQELQEKAKGLGLKYVGVGKEALEEAIAIAEKNGVNTNAPENTNAQPTQEDIENYNAAYVVGDNKKARKYTKEIHGDKFVELAEQYAAKNKLRVELKNDKKVLVCPNCGEKITS